MATTTFFCTECDMCFEDEMDVRNHISEMHLSYFPYKCFTCKKSGVNHETVSVELMYRHISTQHEGIVPDVRFSIELKVSIQNCRRPSVEQTLPNDSKIPLSRILISENSTSTEMSSGASEFEVIANHNNMIRTDEWLTHSIQPDNGSSRRDEPNLGLDLQDAVSESDSKQNVLQATMSFGDTLTDTRDDALQLVSSIEIKQESDRLEVHESTRNDNIGTTNEVITHRIQPESGSAPGDESNLNENLRENVEKIDSQIQPVVSSTAFGTAPNPIITPENIPALSAVPKPESPENVSTVPRPRLKTELSIYVPINVEENQVSPNGAEEILVADVDLRDNNEENDNESEQEAVQPTTSKRKRFSKDETAKFIRLAAKAEAIMAFEELNPRQHARTSESGVRKHYEAVMEQCGIDSLDAYRARFSRHKKTIEEQVPIEMTKMQRKRGFQPAPVQRTPAGMMAFLRANLELIREWFNGKAAVGKVTIAHWNEELIPRLQQLPGAPSNLNGANLRKKYSQLK